MCFILDGGDDDDDDDDDGRVLSACLCQDTVKVL